MAQRNRSMSAKLGKGRAALTHKPRDRTIANQSLRVCFLRGVVSRADLPVGYSGISGSTSLANCARDSCQPR